MQKATPFIRLCEKLGVSLTDDSEDESHWLLIHPEADQSAHVQAMASLPELHVAYMHQVSGHQSVLLDCLTLLLLIMLHCNLVLASVRCSARILKKYLPQYEDDDFVHPARDARGWYSLHLHAGQSLRGGGWSHRQMR